ncbi:MAG: hypothetical protein PVI23_01060 [Maricaulaceae bacterium]|jgi:hypothetical protein
MQFFRALVIGTLNFVGFIAFIGAIVISAFAGWEEGPAILSFAFGPGVDDVELLASIPQAGWAAIGAVIGWIMASLALGVIFVLIDIQDGIRDLHRDLTRNAGSA